MSLEAAVAVLAAIVGAGFVSGREVWVFFAAHGALAPWLGLAATALLGLGAYRTAAYAAGSADPLASLFGRGRPIGHAAIGIFSLLTLAAVLATLGSLARDAMGLPAPLGAALAMLGAGLAAASGISRLRRLQGLLLLAVVLLILGVSLPHLAYGAEPAPRVTGGIWAGLSMFGYVAYNLALATDGIAHSASPRGRGGAIGALVGGLAAGLLLTLEATALAKNHLLAAGSDLPLHAVARALHGGLGWTLGLAVAIAGLTAGASFLVAAGGWLGSPWLAGLLAFGLSGFGVRGLIDTGYPWMAAAAVVWLVRLLFPHGRKLPPHGGAKDGGPSAGGRGGRDPYTGPGR